MSYTHRDVEVLLREAYKQHIEVFLKKMKEIKCAPINPVFPYLYKLIEEYEEMLK